MHLLVTGGCGFIGSNFILHWLKKYPKDKIINLYVLDKDGLVVGFYVFSALRREYTLNLSAVINYIEVYTECTDHGLWRQDLRF